MSKAKPKSMEQLLEEALVPKDEQPYEVPGNWVWVRSGHIAKWGSGGTPSRKRLEYYGGDIPWIKTGELNDGIITGSEETITEEGLQKSSAKIFPKGSIVIAMYGATIGRLGILGIDAATNQACAVGQPYEFLDSKYMFYYFFARRSDLVALGKGGAQPNISQTIIKDFPFALPPLNEQKCIADKIERLFAKIDEAKRLIEEVKESIEQRRAVMLEKAFKGQLGTNDPSEKSILETSDDLSEKDVIPKEQWPYEVPGNWTWIKLKSCLRRLQYGYTATSSTLTEGPKYLRITDIQNDNVDWETVPYCKIDDKLLEKYKLNKGDIVIARTGATTGKSFLIDDMPFCSVFASYLIRLTMNENLNPYYLWNYLKSSMYWKQITIVKKGIAQPGANARIIGELIVPLPPIPEQKRIAEKLDNLLEKLENEKQLVLAAEEKLDLVKQSVLQKAFRGELGTNDPNDGHAMELVKEALLSSSGQR
ncbi:restriction endonuclease subunit S [Geobacillus sp. JS12]|uniref:restriction endonuclease subunit S n=1 Tax=Geobacillus sp. JS12 TaxID=1813182 RepID=UPI00078B8BCB|nr:restriction endonuclease subunit S [Geobacillus sp. JS12]AMQ19917.1 restriction endonuclease [Geobacillus sp. JS12]